MDLPPRGGEGRKVGNLETGRVKEDDEEEAEAETDEEALYAAQSIVSWTSRVGWRRKRRRRERCERRVKWWRMERVEVMMEALSVVSGSESKLEAVWLERRLRVDGVEDLAVREEEVESMEEMLLLADRRPLLRDADEVDEDGDDGAGVESSSTGRQEEASKEKRLSQGRGLST